MTFLCDTEHVNDYSDAAQVVYLILFIEYSFMLTLAETLQKLLIKIINILWTYQEKLEEECLIIFIGKTQSE